MTREQMIKLYNLLSAANAYIIGFVMNGILYYVMQEHINDAYLKMDRMSSKRGGWAKIRVRVSSDEMWKLVNSGAAIALGAASMLNFEDKYNDGEHFERVITEMFTDKKWEKDSVPFNVAGDISVNGKEIQIKFNGAELTNEKTLSRLAA